MAVIILAGSTLDETNIEALALELATRLRGGYVVRLGQTKGGRWRVLVVDKSGTRPDICIYSARVLKGGEKE